MTREQVAEGCGTGPGKEWSRKVLNDYINSLNIKLVPKSDTLVYDMYQRLRLAGMVSCDKYKTVVDLGSNHGGMSYALKEYGLRAVSTEIGEEQCGVIRSVNDDVVRCTSFHLPFHEVDALVSYMFLGMYVQNELANGRRLADIFDELSKSSDTIYSVELKYEYSNWFKKDMCTTDEIHQELHKELPGWDIEYLGDFGVYMGSTRTYRTGFKFKKRGEA